jgi:SAM-dependent methyltransferase
VSDAIRAGSGNVATERGGLRVLNLGCGRRRTEFPEADQAIEIVGVDQSPHSDADIRHDLDLTPWPLPSDTFDLILLQDVLEHLEDVPRALEEICRVARNGARVRIRTPHYGSFYAYGDPTHKRFFSSSVLDLYDVRSAEPLAGEARFRIHRRTLLFPRIWRATGIGWLANRYRIMWEKHLSFIIRAENIFFELEVVKRHDGGAPS